jgi:tetratricopeptide (TPR) repeat protein
MASNQPDSQQIPLTTADFLKDLPEDLQAKLAACTSEFERIDLLNDAAWSMRGKNLKKLLELAQEIYKWSKQIDYKRGIADALRTMGFYNFRFANYKTAIAQNKEAYENYVSADNKKGQASMLGSIGNLYEHLRNHEEALKYQSKGLELWEKLGEKKISAEVLHNIGFIYQNIGEYKKAIDFYQRGSEIFVEYQDFASQAFSLNNLGNVYDLLGDYSTALGFLLKTLVIRQNANDAFGQIRTLQNIGRIYFDIKEYGKSQNYYHLSLVLAQECGYIIEHATAIYNIGHINEVTGHLDTALSLYQKSMAMLNESDEDAIKLKISRSIAMIYFEQQQYEMSVSLLHQCLETSRKTQDNDGIVMTLYVMAKNNLKLNNLKLAIEQLLEALQIALSIDSKPHIIDCHQLLAQGYESFQDFTKALEHYKKYHELKEQVFNEESDRRLKNLQVLHDVEQARLKERQTIRTKLHGDTLSDVTRLHHFGSILKNALAEQPAYHKVATEICDLSVKLDAKLRQLQWGLSETAKTLYETGKHLEKMGRDILEDTAKFVAVGLTPGMKRIELSPDEADRLSDIFKLAVTNIRKHAEASHVTLRFDVTDANILLSVTDDGKGFNVSATGSIGGVADMKRLADELSGKLTIVSPPTGGTTIDVLLPIPTLTQQP